MVFSDFCSMTQPTWFGCSSQAHYLKTLFRSASITREYSDDYLKLVYSGKKPFSSNMKKHFPKPVDETKIATYFESHIQADKVDTLIDAFAVPANLERNKEYLCIALAQQVAAFIRSKDEDVDCIVVSAYETAIVTEASAHYEIPKRLYDGDDLYVDQKDKRHEVGCYSPKLGEAVYRANRASCHRHPKAGVCSNFTSWVVRQIREHKWSLDACCGYAKRLGLFEPSEMVCSRTLYNMVWKGCLSIQPTELPEALKRKAKKHRVRENKKRYGTSISSRPEIASLRLEEGHWEGDTVVGKRAGKESVVLSLLEKKTETYLAFRIPGKTSEAVMNLMNTLHDEYGEHFSQVFKTITVDNGSEFADFAQVENWGSKIFFAHPYTSWERPQNERHNGLFRAFVPKGASIEGFTDEDILAAADEMNGRPRKKLGYCTPEELFEAFLDAVYAA